MNDTVTEAVTCLASYIGIHSFHKEICLVLKHLMPLQLWAYMTCISTDTIQDLVATSLKLTAFGMLCMRLLSFPIRLAL